MPMFVTEFKNIVMLDADFSRLSLLLISLTLRRRQARLDGFPQFTIERAYWA